MQSETVWDALGENALDAWAAELGPDERHRKNQIMTARALRETVAALAWAVPEVAPSPQLRERLLQRVANTKKPSAPPVVAPLLTVRATEDSWCEVTLGIRAKRLFVDPTNGQITALYRFAPGAELGSHRHSGHEQCYVLEGDFDINGEHFGPGDFHCATPQSIHSTVRTKHGALVLIVSPAGYEPITA